MKNLKNIRNVLTFFYLILFVTCLTSCTNNEVVNVNTDSISLKQIESVLTEMKSLGDSQGKIIVFDVKSITKKDYQKYFEVIKNSKDVLDFASGSDSSLERKEDNYTVTCTWGNGETTVTECGSSVGCAGGATWDCLDNGGCATICNARITYTPTKIKQSQDNMKNEIDVILKEVKEIADKENQAFTFTIAFDQNKYWLKSMSIIEKDTFSESQTVRRQDGRKGTFQVDCYDSSGELIWQETYYHTLTASQGILDCTDGGGCAEICEIVARYLPSTKSK